MRILSLILVLVLSSSVCFAGASAVSQVQHNTGVYKAARAKISAARPQVVKKVKAHKPKVNK